MKVVIACAKSKACNAGYMKTTDGRCVKFVGDPDLARAASPKPGFCYARPDGEAGDSKTWRDKLIAYNESCVEANPLGLLPAYKLYTPNKPYKDIYTQLVEIFGIDNVYILSAGWGLIRASFLTPNYDITFSGQADAYKRRGKSQYSQYCDSNHLESAIDEDLLFFGGKDYLPLLCYLTQCYQGRRIVYYLGNKPNCDDVKFVPYKTSTRIWYYECAEKVRECYKSDPCGFDPLKIKG